MYKIINPANDQVIKEFPQHSNEEMQTIIDATHEAWTSWRHTSFEQRATLLKKAANIFRDRAEEYGELIALEMGKIRSEAVAEVVKCGLLLDYYADNGAAMLADEPIDAGFTKAYARYEPMGVTFAIMPWNYPFWQVIRFVGPNLMGGNTCLLKHAPNVFGSAAAMEQVFIDAGFPENAFRSLMIEPDQAGILIEHPMVRGVTLTGSERAGSAVAGKAGKELKKCVMELGGSDPFIVLEDADLDQCCVTAIKARCSNAGQVCIGAKRFFIHEAVYDEFEARYKKMMEDLVIGDPLAEGTQMGPMARKDLMEELDKQVQDSIKEGARLVTGGKQMPGPGNFYLPTILADITPNMTCFQQETFGPVAALIKVKSAEEAIELANSIDYGLGGSVWSKDVKRAEEIGLKLETGQVFINAMTVSHPAVPFGGVKKSGFGRECSHYGIREFQNVKSVVIP